MGATVYRLTEKLEEPGEYLKKATDLIRRKVDNDEKVVCALSGGVDSSTTAEIFRRTIGERLYPIYFDTGFMREIKGKKEFKRFKNEFKDFENFEIIDRKEIFFENIFGIENSEEKRKSFRNTYEKVLNEKIEEIGASTMTQGTIKPDIIETEEEIKSQNNVDTNFNVEKLVEPLAGLYKPQVRRLAKEVGFSKRIWMRQPFLGPGLSARTVGTINQKKLKNEKKANDLVERFVENYFQDRYGKEAIWDEIVGARIPFQYFAATLDNEMEKEKEVNEYLQKLDLDATAFSLKNKATGVKEEEDGKRTRVYSPPLLLKGKLEHSVLSYLGKEIPKKFDYSRLLFQLTESSKEKNWMVAVRAINSKDAINAVPLSIPLEKLEELGEKIIQETDSEIVAYDLTPKPPATIEFE